jgi:hypothetical protein
MARHPDGGMFGIKLIHPNHLKHLYLNDGRTSVMNFSSEGNGPAIAANIPVGHRSLGYLYGIGYQKFVWAFEYTGTVEQGREAAIAQGIQPNVNWNIFRPIRFLAKVEPESAPTAEDIYQRTGFVFKPNRYTMRYISEKDYNAIFDAIWPKKAV